MFHDDIKCILANGQMIINIEADQLYFTQLGSTGHSPYMYAYGFAQYHVIGV